LKWNKMIKEFYGPFHKTVEVTTEESERVTGERILGKDPATGLTLLVRVGRYGPMAQIGSTEEIEAGKIEKSKFAKLRNNQRIDTITFEEALELFKLPRNLGQFEGIDVVVAIGRFGPYVKLGDYFVSMKKEDDPYTVTYDRAVELIHEKRKVQAERIIKTFDEDKDVQVLNGRYGPYIVVKDKNVKIPKDRDPKSLTLEEIYVLAENAPPPKRWGRKSFGNKNQPAFKAPAKKKAAAAKKAPVKAAKKKAAPKKK
jgi:DNA topoisomerase I